MQNMDEDSDEIELYQPEFEPEVKRRPELVKLIGGMAARGYVQKKRGCDPGTAEDLLRQWICAGFLEIWHKPWFLFIPEVDKYQLADACHWPRHGSLDEVKYYELQDFCMIQSTLENISDIIAADDEQQLSEGKLFDGSFSGPAWELDKSKWIPLELAVHQLAKASGLPWPAARAALIQAVNAGRTYALYALYPGREPKAWFRANCNPRLVDPAPPETLVDPTSLAAWIATEYPGAKPEIPVEPQVAEDTCQGWLRREMRAAPDGSSRTKNSWYEEATERFPRLTRRRFYTEWAIAIGATGARWSKPGPRSSRKSLR
jgi:hypothetical protein